MACVLIVVTVTHRSTSVRRKVAMPSIVRELQHTLRSLRAAPGYAAMAILTLALGIGANTLIWSVVDGIVQPSSLVLGYVYRPYTTHTGVVGLLYHW